MSNQQNNLDERIMDYVRGRANAQSIQRLEIEMLEDPELFDRVQTELLLQEGLRTTSLESPDGATRSGRLLQLWSWRLIGPALVGALSLTVAILVVQTVSLKQQVHDLSQPTVGVPVLTLMAERGLFQTEAPGDRATIRQAGRLLIEIDVSAHDLTTFDLELQHEKQTHHFSGIRVDERGYLTVLVPDYADLIEIRVLDPAGRVLQAYR